MVQQRRDWFISAKKKSGLTWDHIAKETNSSRSLLMSYADGTRTPRPKRAMTIGRLVGFDWRLFYDSLLSDEDAS